MVSPGLPPRLISTQFLWLHSQQGSCPSHPRLSSLQAISSSISKPSASFFKLGVDKHDPGSYHWRAEWLLKALCESSSLCLPALSPTVCLQLAQEATCCHNSRPFAPKSKLQCPCVCMVLKYFFMRCSCPVRGVLRLVVKFMQTLPG